MLTLTVSLKEVNLKNKRRKDYNISRSLTTDRGFVTAKDVVGRLSIYYVQEKPFLTIYIKANFRHLGCATRAIQQYLTDHEGKELNALCRAYNTPSYFLLNKIGFKEVSRTDKNIYLIYN